ncbi:TldD/PmbA family protein [Altericroceibacterium endophyticum]|uniref:TldD/PmbA family protein n=1 Tax=Altericroceibacterium endophyticum TaxID=1808508 RepID=A0A6I4T2K0_9SPHN|nr:TldD/PmbA family protein [Altericroceibacterium endophyticum]MXO65454.1 TldD/PmbA family protein [Altericroceibacterium endophyticum]
MSENASPLDPAVAQERCAALIDMVCRGGADSADAVVIGSESQSIEVRLGKLEGADRSESADLGLRVFCDGRSASIHSSDFSDAGLKELSERAIAMAKAAPLDPYAGLAEAQMLAQPPYPDCDLFDPVQVTPEKLREAALAAEDSARATAGVTNSEGGSAGYGSSMVALATSNGFAAAHRATSHSLSASVIAGEGAAMQRDYAYRVARHAEDLPDPLEIGQKAGQRAVARLDPQRVSSGPRPILFDPRIGHSLVAHLIGAMSAAAIARRSSFLLGKENDTLFPDDLRLLERPHRQRGLRSRPFDGEGLPTRDRALVQEGRITGWLTNCAAARQLGIAPTGHASRGAGGAPGISVSNCHLEAGGMSPAELMSDIEDGIYVTELSGQGVNGVTGDYSRGAAGFRIVKGELAGPVAEFTIAGNLLDMFARMSAANDLEYHRTINVPTLRVDGMTVAGE